MELNVLADGTIDNRFRAYINMQELDLVYRIYDPSRPINYGLYSQAGQPTTRSFMSQWKNVRSKVPVAVITTDGRLHNVIPNEQYSPKYTPLRRASRYPPTMYGN